MKLLLTIMGIIRDQLKKILQITNKKTTNNQRKDSKQPMRRVLTTK